MIDVVALVIGSATLVTIVPLLIGCVQWFHRFIGWKDGVEYQQDIESGLGSSQSLSHPDGTLHPPAESVDTDSIKGITFEPLPDIVGQQRGSDAKPDDPAITLVRAVENLRHGGAQYEVPRGHLFYVAEVGSGWFGQVLQGDGEKLRFGQPRTKVVVKMLRDEASLDEQLRFLQEVMLYRVLDHPNMLKFLGQCTDSLPYLTILEHAAFGDMKSYLMNNRENRESFIKRGNLLKFACEMAAGLACMHRHDFIHRDFAARNCLVTHELSVKVGDYGISEETYKEDYTEVDGTMVPLRWLAPETAITDGKLKVTGPTKKSNIWSFGVALWELFMLGERPYSNLADEAVINQVLIERFQQLPEPSTPVSWKSKVYDVMKLCWRDDRPGIEDVHNALKQLELAVTESFSADFDTKWNTLVKQRSRSGSELSSGSGPGGVVMNGSGPPTGVSQPVTLAGPHEMLVTADVLMEDEVQTGFPRPKLLTQLAVEQSEQSWTPSKATEKEFQMTSTPVTKPDTQTSSSYSTAQTSSNNPDMFSTAIDQTPQPVSEGLSLSQIEAEGMVSEDASPSDTSGETVSAPIKEDDQKVAELISLTTEDPIEVDEKSTDVFEIRENPEEIRPAVGANIDNTAGANSSVIPDILENLDQQKSALDAQLEEPSVELLTADGGEAAVIPQVESPSALDTALIPQVETPSVELDKVSDTEFAPPLGLLVSGQHADLSPRQIMDYADVGFRRRSLLARDYGGMLPTIPEDRVPSISDGSNSFTDLNFDSFDDSSVILDNFEWDEDIGRQLVGMVHETSVDNSPRYGLEMSDWSLDQSDVSQLKSQSKRDSSLLSTSQRYSSLLSSAVSLSDESDEEDTPEDNNQKADPSLDQGNLTGQPQTAS